MAKAAKKAFKFVSKVVLGVAGFAVKPIIRALTPKAPIIDISRQIEFKPDASAGVPCVIGRTGTAGTPIYATVGEIDNRNLLYYTILSGGGPIDGFESFSADATAVVFDGADTPTSGPYKSLMWQRRALGALAAAALMPPNTLDAGVLAEWTSAHKTSGYAAAWHVMGANEKAYANGEPAPLWVLRGIKVYDWRLDSTYPGGSGPQRLADQATWTFNENPAVHAVAWALGRYQNGKRVLGLGAFLSQIAMARFTEWANVCDANNWKVGGVVYSTDTKWQILKAICQAGGAYPIPLGSKISVIFNAPRVSIATLTGADIEGDPTIVGTQLRRDRINTATARYRSEANGWQIVAAAPLSIAEFVTEDGGQRSKEMEWPLVQQVNQAVQLAAYGICNSREIGPIDFGLTPANYGLEPGDCITVNEPEFGLTNQKMIIAARDRGMAAYERSITCVTETDSKHDFCLGRSGVAPPLPSLSAVDSLPPAPASSVWTVQGGLVAGENGSLPAIIFDGTLENPNTSGVIVDYRQLTPTVKGWQSYEWPVSAVTTASNSAVLHLELKGLASGAQYELRLRYRTMAGVEDPAVYIALGTVTTGAINAATVGGKTTAQIVADAEATSAPAIAAAQAEATAAQGSANTALSNVAAEILRAQGAEGTLSASIVSLTGTVNGNTSAISAEALTRQTADTALSALITSLTSTVGANKASADSSIAALSTADTAIAASVSSLTGTVGANKASADSSILALSNDQSALASSVNGLKAASSVNPNLVQNGGAQRGFGDWIGASFVVQDIGGPYGPRLLATTNGQAVWSPPFSATAGVQYTASAGLLNYPIGYCQLFIAWYTTTDGTGAVSWSAVQVVNSTGGAFVRAAITRTAPAGAQSGRLYWYAVPNGEPNSQIRQVKVEEGAIATLWSDDASVRSLSASYDAEVVVRTSADAALAASDTSLASAISGNSAAISNNYTTLSGVDSSLALSLSNLSATTTGLSATVTSQGTAIVDVAGKVAAGRFVLSTAAGGGKPNRFTMYSDSLGTNFMALEAANIYFGDNTVFDDATDTLRTVTGSVARVIAWGAVFGASGANLLEWIGDSAVALGSMSKANAYYYTSTTAPYVGGSGLPSGGSTDAVLSKIAEVSNILPNSSGHAQQVYVDMTGVLATDLIEAMVEFSQETVGALPSGAAWHGGWELIEETTSSGSIAVLASGTVDVLETGGGLLDLTTSPEGFFTLSGRSLTGAVRYALRVWKTGGTNLGVPGIHALIRVRRTP